MVRESKPSGSMELTTSSYEKKSTLLPNKPRCLTLTIGDLFDKKQANSLPNRTIKDVQFISSINLSIEILGRFREKVISTFDSPF